MKIKALTFCMGVIIGFFCMGFGGYYGLHLIIPEIGVEFAMTPERMAGALALIIAIALLLGSFFFGLLVEQEFPSLDKNVAGGVRWAAIGNLVGGMVFFIAARFFLGLL